MMNEQRRLQRFEMRLKTSVMFPGRQSTAAHCYTKDISSMGVFLLTDRPSAVGADLELAFAIPLLKSEEADDRFTLLKTSGQVIRSEKNGMAVMFHAPCKITAS